MPPQLFRDRQSSFSGGEFAPSLYGRTDLAKYRSGCRTLENFFVSPYGTLLNRPGTKFIGPVRYDNYNVSGARLVPFVFSSSVSILMVFYEKSIEYYQYNSSTGDVSRLDCFTQTDYVTSDLSALRFAQSGNVITIVHPEYSPSELRRLDSTNLSWSFTALNFDVTAYPLSTVGQAGITMTPTASTQFPEILWDYQVTKILEDSDGRVFESMPYTVTLQINSEAWRTWTEWDTANTNYYHYGTSYVWVSDRRGFFYQRRDTTDADPGTTPSVGGDNIWTEYHVWGNYGGSIAVYPGNPARIGWSTGEPFADADTCPYTILATRVYRGREGVFGFLGETTADYFVDDGAVPDFSIPPPYGENPFDDVNNAPSCVCMYEGRRIFGGSTNNPTRVWGSEVENYVNFDEVVPPLDSDALYFDLATLKYEQVRAIIPRNGLLILTDGSEWLASGSGQGNLLTPNSIYAHPISSIGCGTLEPLVFGDTIMFMQSKGTAPKCLRLSPDGGYQTIDVASISRHLFIGHTIVSWCYAEDPWSTIWAVRDDGVLLSCVFNPDQELIAWSKHTLTDGLVECVCALPEGTEDSVYMVVVREDESRSSARFIEKLTSRVVTDVREGVFLDASYTYDGRNTTAADTIAVAAGAIDATVDITTASIGTELDGLVVRVYAVDGSSILIDMTYVSADHYHGRLLEELDTAIAATSDWEICRKVISGLPETIGSRQVHVLADGNVCEDLEANSGSVTIPEYAAIVHVGIPYNSDFESLDLVQDRSSMKIAKHVCLETASARGGYAGVDFDNLTEFPGRKVSDGYGTIELQNENLKVNIPSSWGEVGRVCFRQSDPLPVEILGITREIAMGG